MKKIFLLLLIGSLILLVGCGGGNIDENDNQKNYTYFIEHSPGSANTASSSDVTINDEDNLYATKGQIRALVAWKIFDDGSFAKAKGVWSYDSSENAYIEDTESVLSINSIAITSPTPDTGKITLYVPEDDTTVSKNVYIYGITKVDNYENGEHGNIIDFDSEIKEADIIFDGFTINAEDLFVIKNSRSLSEVTEIPQSDLIDEYTFENIDEMFDSVITFKTKEGNYAKINLHGGYTSSGRLNATVHYYVEKDSTTEFAY